MEDEEGQGPLPPQRVGRPERFCQSEVWNNIIFSLSYWCFEAICFTALLSMSIGLSALAALGSEYFVEQKMSIFLQTYTTLFTFYNFGNFQAKHQIVYIYPLRQRFGTLLDYCFYCNYPSSTPFVLLVAAYLNLLYQFSKLICPFQWQLLRNSNVDDSGHHSSQGGIHKKGVEVEDATTTNFKNSVHQGMGTGKSDYIIDRSFNDLTNSNWQEIGMGLGIPAVGLTTTTALFLLSLCTILYLTCRKFKWDYYLEVARIAQAPVFPSCCSFLYAFFVLLFIQLVLTVLYTMPVLLWLLLSKLFQWHLSTTLLTTMAWAVVIGFIGAFVERQEPFPTVNHSRMYQIVNLKLRSYIMCLAFIPGLAYWFFTMEGTVCIIPTMATATVVVQHNNNNNNKNQIIVDEGQNHSSSSPINQINGGTGGLHSQADIFNYFLLNVAVCIISTTKYVRLSSMDRLRHDDPLQLNNRLRHLRHHANANGNLLGDQRVGHIHPHLPPPPPYPGNPPGPGQPPPPPGPGEDPESRNNSINGNLSEINNNSDSKQNPNQLTTDVRKISSSLQSKIQISMGFDGAGGSGAPGAGTGAGNVNNTVSKNLRNVVNRIVNQMQVKTGEQLNNISRSTSMHSHSHPMKSDVDISPQEAAPSKGRVEDTLQNDELQQHQHSFTLLDNQKQSNQDILLLALADRHSVNSSFHSSAAATTTATAVIREAESNENANNEVNINENNGLLEIGTKEEIPQILVVNTKLTNLTTDLDTDFDEVEVVELGQAVGKDG